MAFEVGAVFTLKDNFSATFKTIKNEQTKFKKDIESTKKALDSAFDRKQQLKVDNAYATKTIKSTIKTLEPLRNKVITTLAYKDHLTGRLNEATNRVKTLGKMVVTPMAKLKDNVSKAADGIKEKLNSLKQGVMVGVGVAGGLAVGGAVAAGKMIGQGALLERQQISMEHFIGVQNKGMSQDQVKATSQQYLQDLRTNADLTPFETNEVIGAGTRAISIASGNTSSAMEMLKMAENMAALNPEKSLSDAMEAIADLKTGETERMKEFGFKISQDDIKKANGNIFGIKNSDGISIQDMFKGGSDKLSTSASGLWSTITGTLSTAATNTGFKMLEALKPTLEKIVPLVSQLSPAFEKIGDSVGKGISTAINYVWQLFDRFNQLKGNIKSYEPILNIFKDIFTISMSQAKASFEVFQNGIKTVGPVVMRIVSDIGNMIANNMGWISERVNFVRNLWNEAWPGIADVLNTSWGVIKPVIDIIINSIKIVWDLFELAFPSIKKVISNTWEAIKPIMETLGKTLGFVSDNIGKLAGWLNEKLQSKKTESSAGTYVNGSHANGLDYVPFDNYIAALHKGEAVIKADENPYNPANRNRYNPSENTSYQHEQIVSKENQNKIEININAVGKSTEEIMSELVPQIKLAMANI